MWAGRMTMFRKLVVALAVLASPAGAETAGCADLAATLKAMTGYALAAAPAPDEAGWCVFDHAVLEAQGAPDLAAERLRLQGGTTDGALSTLALDAGGVRLAPGLSQRGLDPTLREMLRLQTAELHVVLTEGPEGLTVSDGRIALSGGTEVKLEAELSGAGLSPGALLTGRVTRARLDWRNDGRLLRAPMEAAARGLGAKAGPQAVDAVRAALRKVVQALPAATVTEKAREALDALVDALPQGRGRLRLELTSPGIGAAQLGVLALADDPAGPEALGRLFAGTVLVADWQPGLAP